MFRAKQELHGIVGEVELDLRCMDCRLYFGLIQVGYKASSAIDGFVAGIVNVVLIPAAGLIAGVSYPVSSGVKCVAGPEESAVLCSVRT